MLRVAMIGLGFGAEFIPIYQRHPQAELAAICRRDRAGLDEVGDQFGVEKRYTDYRELLKDPDIDAVHINSPIPDHAWMTLEALKAGKHVACTVPMATSIEDCRRIVEAVERTGLKYMMMETVVYAREYLYIKELYDTGELGKLQFLQASHMQDMDGWPNYWPGLPPMWYATHCVGPMLALTDATRRGRVLLRLRHDPRGADRALRLAVRGRDRARQVPGLRPHRAHQPHPVRRRPPVPREHRRLRLQAGVRVDADRGRAARAAHGQAPGAGDPREDRGARLRATGCPSRSSASRPRASTTTRRRT